MLDISELEKGGEIMPESSKEDLVTKIERRVQQKVNSCEVRKKIVEKSKSYLSFFKMPEKV